MDEENRGPKGPQHRSNLARPHVPTVGGSEETNRLLRQVLRVLEEIRDRLDEPTD